MWQKIFNKELAMTKKDKGDLRIPLNVGFVIVITLIIMLK